MFKLRSLLNGPLITKPLFWQDLTTVWEDYGVIILIFIPRETFNQQFKQEKQ